MAFFDSMQSAAETLNNLTNATNTAETILSASGSDEGVSSSSDGTTNPYSLMYKDNYGYVFGKPLAFNDKADPNQRVYQKTLLRNNTILNFIPGVPYQDSNMIAKAQTIVDAHYLKLSEIRADTSMDSTDKEKAITALTAKTQSQLVDDGVDLRYSVFKQDIAGFLQAFQIVVNRVGTAIFGWKGSAPRMITDLAGLAISEDAVNRGFKVWVEKGTSISESIDNAFTRSVLEDTIKSASNVAKQLKFIGQGLGISTADTSATQISSDTSKQLESVGTTSNLLSRTVSGSNFQFPQIFDDSKFNRSYEISFRFVSPYGDDRSVMYHVINPFLFMLTCAMPRQEGVSGVISPFLLQVDCPGYFSCPMGVVSSFSFKKGGDDSLFNARGLPLIIEGSMTIMDLYSSLSLPLNYTQFATNLGTTSFLNTLGGLSLYASMDPSVATRFTNRVKDGITSVISPINIVNEEILKLKRFFGVQ